MTKKYRDMLVAKGTRMYELLESNKPEDKKKLEEEYKLSNNEFFKAFPKELWDRLTNKENYEHN
jgi:hypothetical protein